MPRRPTIDFDSVSVDDVSRHYGRRRALAHVSLQIERGEVLGLFGPNGAGKSTLISVLSTLLRPTSGLVRYGSHTSDDAGDGLRGHIGVLGHDLFLYGDLTARENLTFFGRLYGLDRPDSDDRHDRLDERVTEALRLARLTDRADDRTSSFSRGLRQRLALERALLHRPRLVLLDEPFTGLDDDSALVLIERLRSLREQGAMVVMATHDFDTAESVVDRAICVDRGRARPMTAGSGSLRDRYRHALKERD